MRKFTGKAVSLVLAMALAVSSFSSTLGFAAKTTEKAGSVDFGTDNKDEITLAKPTDDNGYIFDVVEDMIVGMTFDTVDKEYVGVSVNADDIKVAHSSGKSLVSIKNEDGGPKLRVKKNETGTEKLMVSGEVTITRDDKDVVLKGQKEITINVVSTDDRFVVDAQEIPDAGDDKPGDLEVTADNGDEIDVMIISANANANSIAEYTKNEGSPDSDNSLMVQGSDNGKFKLTTEDKDLKNVVKIMNNGKGPGSTKLTIKEIKDNKPGKTISSTNAVVLKKVTVDGDATVAKKDGKVKLLGAFGGSIDMKDSNLSGYDIQGTVKDSNDAYTGKLILDDSASVGKVSKFGTVSVSGKAKTGDIADVSSLVSIDDANSVVGTIDDIKGDVRLSEGRVAKIVTSGEVNITGGTVTGDVTADEAVIDANDDEINTVIGGTLKAKTLTIDPSSDAKISIKAIKLKTDGVATLKGEGTDVGVINADYKGTVTFEDFQGKVAGIQNADTINADEDTTASIAGDVSVGNLSIDEGGVLEFAGKVTAKTLSGDGKIVVGVDKLYVTEDANSGIVLKLAGNNVNVGDVAYTATKDAADVDSLIGFGFTMEQKSANKDQNKFLVKATSFAGLAFDKSEITIAKGFKDTVTVSNYPASTQLPAGAKVEWNYDDADTDVFKVTENGATVTIEVIGFDADYATSNNFDLTATVVDADGDALEDYDDVTCKVIAISEYPITSDVSGIVEVPQGSTKNFSIMSGATASPSVGNAAVAQIGTVSAFANGKGTYAVKAIGAVGSSTGVYATANGVTKQIFTIKVTAAQVIVDTTVDFSLAKGARYVYKVTAPSVPNFTVGNGNVLKTQAGKVVGNDYYYSVYAVGNPGQSTGVYVNGVKYTNVTIK